MIEMNIEIEKEIEMILKEWKGRERGGGGGR